MNTQTTNENPLGTQPVKKLLMQFAIPSIVAMLVSSLYNIVDSMFVAKLSETALTAASLV